MKKLLSFILVLAFAVGCGKSDKIFTPDYKGLIDSTVLRVDLLEVNDSLQDLRIDSLEVIATDLTSRLEVAEDLIDINEANILNLFSRTNYLAAGLAWLYNDLHRHVRELELADRLNRQALRNEVRSLRYQLSREIRSRQLADADLQDQIDNLEIDLSSFEARQNIINSFLARGLAITNFRISQLRNQVNNSVNQLTNYIDGQISLVQTQINDIKGDIVTINNEIDAMQIQIANIESSVLDIADSATSVVYPCGAGNSQEVLLKTEAGLVAYFQEVRNQTDTAQANTTIPEHFVCDKFFSGNGNNKRCKEGRNVPASSASSTTTYTHQVLVKAYLDVLADGSYRTTDGYSCNFTISNGEVL